MLWHKVVGSAVHQKNDTFTLVNSFIDGAVTNMQIPTGAVTGDLIVAAVFGFSDSKSFTVSTRNLSPPADWILAGGSNSPIYSKYAIYYGKFGEDLSTFAVTEGTGRFMSFVLRPSIACNYAHTNSLTEVTDGTPATQTQGADLFDFARIVPVIAMGGTSATPTITATGSIFQNFAGSSFNRMALALANRNTGAQTVSMPDAGTNNRLSSVSIYSV